MSAENSHVVARKEDPAEDLPRTNPNYDGDCSVFADSVVSDCPWVSASAVPVNAYHAFNDGLDATYGA